MWIAYGVSNIGDGAAYAVVEWWSIPSLSPSASRPPSMSPPISVNDRCSRAKQLTCSDLPLATTSQCMISPLREASGTEDGLWYAFVVMPATVSLVLDTSGSSMDTQLVVFQGAACLDRDWACTATNDDRDLDDTASYIQLNLPKPGNYWAFVYGYGGASGSVTFTVQCTSANRCDRARLMMCNQTVEGGTTGYNSADPSIQNCKAAPTVALVTWFWLRVKPPVSLVTLSTYGSNFDTQLTVYTGSNCVMRECIASNDDAPSSTGLHSQVVLPGASNRSTLYMIAVHGYGASNGLVRLGAQCSFQLH